MRFNLDQILGHQTMISSGLDGGDRPYPSKDGKIESENVAKKNY